VGRVNREGRKNRPLCRTPIDVMQSAENLDEIERPYDMRFARRGGALSQVAASVFGLDTLA
jgi:hypothetical protein